jgi:hypothetical protein
VTNTVRRSGSAVLAAAVFMAAVACGSARSQATSASTAPASSSRMTHAVSITTGAPPPVGTIGVHPGTGNGALGPPYADGSAGGPRSGVVSGAASEAVTTARATPGSVITNLVASAGTASKAASGATGSSPGTRASAARRVGTTPVARTTSLPVRDNRKVARKTTTTVAPTTLRTIMGGGNPATWPAARRFPPSLAGAYSTNLKTAFISLVNYSDWLGSHPNPNLVRNYVATNSNIYHPQVYLMQQMLRRGWHISPQPTEITSLKVLTPLIKRKLRDGQAYSGGGLEVVIDEKRYAYLDRAGRVVGHTAGGGETSYVVTLVQNRLGTQFRIDLWVQLPAVGHTRAIKRQS